MKLHRTYIVKLVFLSMVVTLFSAGKLSGNESVLPLIVDEDAPKEYYIIFRPDESRFMLLPITIYFNAAFDTSQVPDALRPWAHSWKQSGSD